jgi:predicted Fe-S protein YdhL (DUF1289 family)
MLQIHDNIMTSAANRGLTPPLHSGAGKQQREIPMPQLQPSAIPSPCRNICVVKQGVCTGCGRTLAEIESWPTAADSERRDIIARAAARIRH